MVGKKVIYFVAVNSFVIPKTSSGVRSVPLNPHSKKSTRLASGAFNFASDISGRLRKKLIYFVVLDYFDQSAYSSTPHFPKSKGYLQGCV